MPHTNEGAVAASCSKLVLTAARCASTLPETSKSNMNSCFFILLVYLKHIRQSAYKSVRGISDR